MKPMVELIKMPKPAEYMLITDENPGQLSVYVNKMLEEGWDLYGSPSVTIVNDAGCDEHPTLYFEYIQALVRYE